MRDYILTQSMSRDSTFAFPKLRRIVRSWVLKRNLKALEALDAHLLDDIERFIDLNAPDPFQVRGKCGHGMEVVTQR